MTIEKLDQFTLLRISGADSQTFLQGQLTNDISKLATGWQLTGYCNPKGRLITLLRLWQSADVIYALLDRSIAEAVVKRLRMYVMRSDVAIEEQPDARVLGCFSDTDHDGLAEMQAGDVKVLNQGLVALSYGQRFMLIDMAQKVNAKVGSQWLITDIQEGVPSIEALSSELFVPQMLNLDLLQAISFKKGCYTGQEIVARMHYLGKLKQRMYLCEVSNISGGRINAGDKVIGNGKNVGTIVSAAKTSSPAATSVKATQTLSDEPKPIVALAVLRTNAAGGDGADSSGATVFTLDKNDATLIVLPKQPYSLASAS